jgi:hypothetical protein
MSFVKKVGSHLLTDSSDSGSRPNIRSVVMRNSEFGMGNENPEQQKLRTPERRKTKKI